jgi:hypothetical protein
MRTGPGRSSHRPFLFFLALFTNVVERLSEKGVLDSNSLL